MKHNQIIDDILQWINIIGLGQVTVKLKFLSNIATVFYIYNVSALVIATFLARSSDDFFDYFSVLGFSGMGILKLSSLRLNDKEWINILSEASNLQAWELTLGQSAVSYDTDDENCKPCVNFSQKIGSYVNYFNFTKKWLLKLYFTTVVIFTLSPFIEYALYNLQGVEAQNPHVLLGWSPFDDNNIIVYILTLIIEIVAAFYCVLAHTSFDISSVGIIIVISGQYSILHEYAENICGKGSYCSLSKRRDERAHLRISHCHRIQQLLVKMTRELDRVQRNILGVYFMLATLTLCSVAVRLNADDLGVTALITLLQYMGACLAQLFLFCRFGDVVSMQSSMGMGEGIFGSAYWCISPKIRRELHILSFDMIKSHSLHAGPFHTLDLQSFVQVIRATYSYYTIVQKSM